MPIRLLLAGLLFTLVACDDDSTGPGAPAPGPSVIDRALDLRNFFPDEAFVAPGSTSRFDSVHQTGVVTIEAWVELTGLGNSFATICANKADETEAGFYFGIEARDDVDNRRLRLNITDENGNTVLDAQGTPGSITFGSWQHLVVVSDGTEVRFSIDGVVETVTPTVADLGSTAPAARDLSVGSTVNDVSVTFGLDARMDELRIWSQARTNDQLADFASGPLPADVFGAAGSGLLGYWTFDTFENLTTPSDGADDLRDRSVGGAHLDAPSEARLSAGGAFTVIRVNESRRISSRGAIR